MGSNSDGFNYSSVVMDGVSGQNVKIDFEHYEVHEGDSYHSVNSQNVNTATFKWQVTTPNTDKFAHMIFGVQATGEVTVLITEGSDRTDGTAMGEMNRDRNSTNTAGVIVTYTPTAGATDGATTILTTRIGATGVGSKTLSPGAARGTAEWILKKNTKYVISATTYADIWVTFIADWYEHTDTA